MDSILVETRKLFERLSEKKGVVDKVKRFAKAGGDEEKINLLKERLTLLSQQATYLTLVKSKLNFLVYLLEDVFFSF